MAGRHQQAIASKKVTQWYGLARMRGRQYPPQSWSAGRESHRHGSGLDSETGPDPSTNALTTAAKYEVARRIIKS